MVTVCRVGVVRFIKKTCKPYPANIFYNILEIYKNVNIY